MNILYFTWFHHRLRSGLPHRSRVPLRQAARCGYSGATLWLWSMFIGHHIMSGWWFQPIPLKNDGLRQLGWWHSQYMESHKIPWFQTTNQMSYYRPFPQTLASSNGFLPMGRPLWFQPAKDHPLLICVATSCSIDMNATTLCAASMRSHTVDRQAGQFYAEFVASDSTEPWENHHFSRPLPWTSCPCLAYLLWTYHPRPCHAMLLPGKSSPQASQVTHGSLG